MSSELTPYRDFWARLITSIVISLFLTFLGSSSFADIISITKGKYFIPDILAGIMLVFIVTTYINIITSYLDIQYPWNKNFTTRIFYQIVAGIMIPSFFVLFYMYTYLLIIMGYKKEDVDFFYTELPIGILFIIFWNFLYVGFYFYQKSKEQKVELESLKEKLFTLQNVKPGPDTLQISDIQKEPGTDDEDEEYKEQSKSDKINILIAVSGNKNIPIPVETIAYFYKNGNYTTLKTFQSDTYLLNHSLEELSRVLEDNLFFRANRQFIINLKACQYFTNEENGKLAVHLSPSHEESIIISQKRASAYKEWLNK